MLGFACMLLGVLDLLRFGNLVVWCLWLLVAFIFGFLPLGFVYESGCVCVLASFWAMVFCDLGIVFLDMCLGLRVRCVVLCCLELLCCGGFDWF